MELILATQGGTEERVLDCEYDIEIGGANTFELSIPYSDWKNDITFKKRIYIPGTEYGGIIQDIEGDTAKETVFVRGYTWRGYLYKMVYTGTLHGELNAVIASLLGQYEGVFIASRANTKKSASMTFDHVTVGEALSAFVMSVGYRLQLTYVQTQIGGYVLIEAVPAVNYSNEVTQDSLLDFTTRDNRMGINHMVCVNGNQTVHLYADAKGNVSTRQSIYGIDEITEYFISESNSFVDEGRKRLIERGNKKTMTVGFDNANEMDLSVGDFVTGLDYITGISVTKPITIKILKLSEGNTTIEYDVEDES